jgi:hypothetical protein
VGNIPKTLESEMRGEKTKRDPGKGKKVYS